MTLIFDEDEQGLMGYKEIEITTVSQFSFNTSINARDKVLDFSLTITGSNPKIKVVD